VEVTEGMRSNHRDEQERWIDRNAATTEGRKSRNPTHEVKIKELWADRKSCRNELEVFLELLESPWEASPRFLKHFLAFHEITHLCIFELMQNVMHKNPPANPPARAPPRGSGAHPT
jgi:hypothetical protein